jgi:hypothetical protein
MMRSTVARTKAAEPPTEFTCPSGDTPGPTISIQLRATVSGAGPESAVALTGKPAAPVSPADPPTDEMIFQDAADPDKKYYLPRYRLAEESVSGQTRYRMALESLGSHWCLTIVFEKFPAPELGSSARNAQELPHKPEIVLLHRVFQDGSPAMTKERPFTDLAPVDGGLRGRLMLESLEERDVLYRALTEPAYTTNVIVRRNAPLAVPVSLAGTEVPVVSSGATLLRPNERLDLVTGSIAEGSSGHIQWTSGRKIVPLGAAQLALLGKLNFEQVTFAMLEAATHASTELSSTEGWDANSVVNATPLWNPSGRGGVYDANPFGVWHTGSAWSIFHQNMQAMVQNAAFVVTNSKQGSTGFIHKARASSPQWSGWASLGAPPSGFLNAPSAVSRSPQFCSVYVRGGEGALWQLPFDGNWHGWIKHDGNLIAEPAVDSMNPAHEHVFAQGTDGQLLQKWWAGDGGGWRGWFPLGAPAPGFSGRPATVSRNPQVCDVYVRGRDNALWQLTWSDGHWHGWVRHRDGAVLASPPAVGSMNANHEHVFIRGTDGQVWAKWWQQGAGWSAWAALGAPPNGFIGGPAISQTSTACDLFVRGGDNALWQRSYRSGVWGAWESHGDGGVLADDLATASLNPNHLQIFVRGTDGKVWQKFLTGGSQSGGNISGHTTVIDHPALNGNANAVFQATQNWNPGGAGGTYNSRHIGIYYTGSRWALFNEDLSAMPAGAAFNIRLGPPNRSFVHRAAPENINGHVTIIRRAGLDGNPEAMLLITPNWNPPGSGGVYNDHPTGVYYTGSNWGIYNQDLKPMPAGAAFNVEIVDPREGFVHQARPETNSGNFTVMEVATQGVVTKNRVISARILGDTMAKLLVLESAELLSLQWTTYSKAPRFREETFGLELSRLRESFVFPPGLYPYIFRGITDVSDGHSGVLRRTAEWKGIQYPYYQDETPRRLFYYLPDSFKIARRSSSVRSPNITVGVSSPNGSLEKTVGSLSYVAVPATETARLETARQRLQEYVPEGAGNVLFELLPASKLSFKLGLPKPGGTAVSFTEQTDALVTMTKLRHSIELPIEGLQAVFEAIFSSSSLVFQGQIEVTFGKQDPIPPIPFEARMNDLSGDPLECSAQRGESGIEASLRNVIESPLRIRQIDVTLRSGTTSVAARMEGLTVPLDLAAGQRVSYRLVPAAPLEAAAETQALFDLRDVEVVPDREAIWNAILETTVQPQYIRKIGVRTVAELFHGPEPRISLVRVDLQRGGGQIVAVDLTEQQLQAEALLSSPLRDYILGRTDLGVFRYQVLTVRGGMRTEVSPWKESSTNLIITTEDLA